MSVAQPVALVTGARKGIGRHLAEHLAATGYRVVGCSRSAPDFPLPPGSEHVVTDVRDERQVIALMRDIQTCYGRLDVVINNAGIAAMNPVLLTPGATATDIVQTNLLGTVLVTREGAKLMMRRRAGRIVNFTSVAVPLQLEGEAVYAASKSAVETFTRIFAREVAPYGITVNAIGPGPVETDLLRGVPPAKIDALVQRLPDRRMTTMQDITQVIDTWLRPDSASTTGQVIYLGGVK